MTRAEILERVARFQEAWATRNAMTIAGAYTAGATYDSPAYGVTRGRGDIAKRLQSWFSAFPDMTMQWDEPLVDGDRAVLPFRAVGTVQGAFFGVPATNKRAEIDGVILLTVAVGGVSQARFVYDFSSVLLKVGILRAKPS